MFHVKQFWEPPRQIVPRETFSWVQNVASDFPRALCGDLAIALAGASPPSASVETTAWQPRKPVAAKKESGGQPRTVPPWITSNNSGRLHAPDKAVVPFAHSGKREEDIGHCVPDGNGRTPNKLRRRSLRLRLAMGGPMNTGGLIPLPIAEGPLSSRPVLPPAGWRRIHHPYQDGTGKLPWKDRPPISIRPCPPGCRIVPPPRPVHLP